VALGIAIPELPVTEQQTKAAFAIANASAAAQTNVDGEFSMTHPPRGRFLLYAAYRDSFSELEWLVPVAEDATTIELNNTNARGSEPGP
jgi:hypothetical protein